MANLSGNENPSASDVRSILNAIGADVDDTIVGKLISEMQGKTVYQVIAAGMSKLQSVPSGGGTVTVSAGVAPTSGAAAVQEEKKVEEEPEEEDDMGFSLFD